MAVAESARTQVGNWILRRPVGHGAWTVVFRAYPANSQLAGEGDYAVKMLAAGFEKDRTGMQLLQREAFVARQVQHKHLTTVLASELDAPPYYLVSPYYEGVVLSQSIAGGRRFTTPHALWISRQLAEALCALHAAGWLHLDVNPANVIVSSTGHATLIDLGLAQRIDERTAQRMLVGTLSHMAPETFQSQLKVSPAADIYGLGVVLYQLLVGALPFEDDDPMLLAAAHVETPPPALRERLPQVPTRLARLLRRMLSKEPLRRPAMDELIATLADLEIETFAERMVA
jgi:serine/threonine-protein kinase